MMIIKKNRIYVDLNRISYSIHSQSSARKMRMNRVGEISSMKIMKAFWVDKGHPNGAEIHLITEDANILVINARTFKLCTVLIARPGQIQRYYKAIHQPAPEKLIKIAILHQKNGENKI